MACLNRPSGRSAKALEAIKEEFPNGDVRQVDMDLSKLLLRVGLSAQCYLD